MIKVAGGVFHTHHHLADNRLETLIALAFKEGISSTLIKGFESADSIEEALLILERNIYLQAIFVMPIDIMKKILYLNTLLMLENLMEALEDQC